MTILVNLFFCKIGVLKYSDEVKSEFGIVSENDDTVVTWGRYEFYIIPRHSKSFQ
jgi:hypothetical protein